MFIAQLTGMEDLIKGVRDANDQIGGKIERGLTKCGLLLQRYSQLIVPVDKGNLRGSAYTRLQGKGFFATVDVGYTANYAIYVHENMDAAHGEDYNQKYAAQIAAGDKGFHTRGANQKAKFLIGPAIEHRGEFLSIMAGAAI
jgi:hypothetical protein